MGTQEVSKIKSKVMASTYYAGALKETGVKCERKRGSWAVCPGASLAGVCFLTEVWVLFICTEIESELEYRNIF